MNVVALAKPKVLFLSNLLATELCNNHNNDILIRFQTNKEKK